jgi:hypothetical protein
MLPDHSDGKNGHPTKYMFVSGNLACGCAAQPLFLLGGG